MIFIFITFATLNINNIIIIINVWLVYRYHIVIITSLYSNDNNGNTKISIIRLTFFFIIIVPLLIFQIISLILTINIIIIIIFINIFIIIVVIFIFIIILSLRLFVLSLLCIIFIIITVII